MARTFQIHSKTPQLRLIRQVVDILLKGGVIVYPTDSCYALGCRIGEKMAMERIQTIRQLDAKHRFTLVCRNLSELSTYAKVDNSGYRLIKALTAGPYTFILKATREVPSRLKNPKRKTIGLRVPDHPIVQLLLETLKEPLLSSTMQLFGDDLPITDPHEINGRLFRDVDAIIDGGNCGVEPTTVIDLVADTPVIVRQGKGDTRLFEF